MRDRRRTFVVIAASVLLTTLGCLHRHERDLPPPQRDVWPNAVCASAVGAGPPAFDFGKMLQLSDSAIDRSAEPAAIDAAYAYARAHCYPLWLGSGDRLLREGDYADAFFFYSHASFYDGDNTIGPPFDGMHIEIRLQNALMDASKGKFDASLVTMREVSAIAPDFPDAHYYQGDLLLALHKPAKARAEWLTALRCHGTNSPTKAKVGPDDAWMSALLMYESKV